MDPDVILQFVGAFVVYCFRLVVNLAVFEDSTDVVAEVFPVSVLVVRQLLLDGLQVDWLLYHKVVIRDVFWEHWLSEGPRGLMLLEEVQNILAFQEEGNLLGLDELLMVLPSPSTFFDSRDVHGINPKVLVLTLSILPDERLPDSFLKQIPIEPMTVN